jgi:hypothetical protein
MLTGSRTYGSNGTRRSLFVLLKIPYMQVSYISLAVSCVIYSTV